MLINVEMTYYYDTVSIPIEKISVLKLAIERFDEFIHCKSNDHPYWVYQKKSKIAPEVNTDTLVWWLNNKYFSDGKKATIISRENDIGNVDNNIYTIYL